MADAPIALAPGEGEHLGTTVVKVSRPELSLLEFEVQPGGGVKPHFHKLHSDSFFVLAGELEIHLGDQVVHASPGTYALAPPGVVHYFRNTGSEPARALNLHTPGGFAEYRRELQMLHSRGEKPDAGFFERHDIYDID